jgi:hypothetical protein
VQDAKGLWIAWPSNKKDGALIKDFEFINKDLKK